MPVVDVDLTRGDQDREARMVDHIRDQNQDQDQGQNQDTDQDQNQDTDQDQNQDQDQDTEVCTVQDAPDQAQRSQRTVTFSENL